MMDGTFAGKEILTSEDESENATATIYEIIRFNMEAGNCTGVAIALFHTNSAELLAPLDGMILTGRGELYTDETGLHSSWKWQSGIPWVVGWMTLWVQTPPGPLLSVVQLRHYFELLFYSLRL
jgi:hypothetical protein